jgi:Transposase, Mutator family
MPNRRIPDAAIDQLLESYSKPEDLVGASCIWKQPTSRLVERMLQGEVTAHPGNPQHGRRAGKARNGAGSKKLKTDHGPVQVEVPRDRDGTFEPLQSETASTSSCFNLETLRARSVREFEPWSRIDRSRARRGEVAHRTRECDQVDSHVAAGVRARDGVELG